MTLKRLLLTGAMALLLGACGEEARLGAPTAAIGSSEDALPVDSTTAAGPTTPAPTVPPIATTAMTAAPPRPATTAVAAPRTTVPTLRTTPTVATASGSCHPSYRGGCLPVDASDVDCRGGSGNGPVYTDQVQVVGPDVFDLDRDGDGIGCE